MKYEVLAVDDDALPDGVHHVIVERMDEPPLLLINGAVARCWHFMRTWEDSLEPCWQPTVTLPVALPPMRLVV